MVFFGIFGSGNLLRDGERTSSEPGDTEETATTQVPVTTEQTAGEETHTTSDAQMTDRKSTRLNSSHNVASRMPSSA